VIYVEAERGKVFHLQDATLLTAMMTHTFRSIQEAQATLDGQSIPLYRFGDFEGADLHRAVLTNQNLSQAVFKMAYLVEANLGRSNLTGSSFDLADLSGANLKSATIVGASFRAANLLKCNFDGADVKYCRFDRSDLSGCHFAGASLESCTFIDSRLSDIEFRDLDVSTINFTNAVMRNCVLKRLRGVESASWSGVDLSGSTIGNDVWCKLPKFIRAIHSSLVTHE
ncbi:MAG: pentapeptide repeat-containing protein, partial [Cyanobium sp.]